MAKNGNPILFMVKNGNAFAVYFPKDLANISNGSLFRIPTIFHGFHYHPLPYITITAFQFSKQPASNIQFAHQFVKSYLKNTPSWVILIRDGVMMEYFL